MFSQVIQKTYKIRDDKRFVVIHLTLSQQNAAGGRRRKRNGWRVLFFVGQRDQVEFQTSFDNVCCLRTYDQRTAHSIGLQFMYGNRCLVSTAEYDGVRGLMKPIKSLFTYACKDVRIRPTREHERTSPTSSITWCEVDVFD